MQETIVIAVETVCYVIQENNQLIFIILLLAAYFMHSRIEAYLQAVT